MRIEQRRLYLRWAFALCLAVVLILALMPPRALVPPTGWDKASHVLAFAVLAILGAASYPQRKTPVLLGLVAYGGMIELLQALTGYRSAEWRDLVADGVGVVLGWHLPSLSLRLRLPR